MGLTGGGTPSGTKTSFDTSVAVTYIGTANENTNVAAKSFGNFSVASNGQLVVWFSGVGSTSRTVATVSIGTTSAEIYLANGNANGMWALASASVSAGSIPVAVTLSGAPGNTGPFTAQVLLVTSPNNTRPFWADMDPVDGTAGWGSATLVRSLVYPNVRNAKYIYFLSHATNEAVTWQNGTSVAATVNTRVFAVAQMDGTSTLLQTDGVTETPTWATSSSTILAGMGWI